MYINIYIYIYTHSHIYIHLFYLRPILKSDLAPKTKTAFEFSLRPETKEWLHFVKQTLLCLVSPIFLFIYFRSGSDVSEPCHGRVCYRELHIVFFFVRLWCNRVPPREGSAVLPCNACLAVCVLHCNTLLHTAHWCSVQQCVAMQHASVLQCVATLFFLEGPGATESPLLPRGFVCCSCNQIHCCNTVPPIQQVSSDAIYQCLFVGREDETRRCMLQCIAVWYSVLQCVAVCCNVLQCVAMCCSVLKTGQDVACCSVLQCVENGTRCCVSENDSLWHATRCNTQSLWHTRL